MNRTTQLLTSTVQHTTIDGHIVEHTHTTLYECVMLNGVVVFIDSNVPTVAAMYDAVCRGLSAQAQTPTRGLLTADDIAEMG